LRRVAVIGTCCSGKTTLAASIAAIRGCRHVELDAIHWLPDWVERPVDEFRELTAGAVADESWTVDGNYSRARDLVWARATHVVWLNYPFPVVLWRAIRRTLRRMLTREELYSGNRESFRLVFLDRESILLQVVRSHWRRRREYRELCTSGSFPHIEFIELRHPRESRELLARLEAAA
jgi:adenylate kinase family enzyme